MSRYSETPLSCEGLKTVAIAARGANVRVLDDLGPNGGEKGGTVVRTPKDYIPQALRSILDKDQAA